MPTVIDGEVRRVLEETLRRRAASVRLSLGWPTTPLQFTGMPEGDPDVLAGWRLHANIDGSGPEEDAVPIALRLDRFERAHVENETAIFVSGDNRLEIRPALAGSA
ncbi:MAG: hypothetical protein JO225_11045 [Candidatus Eremiobacteraeota bacterium]|nr:hypothetical protein [Candidatus Eremiobacteraeota bacterium]MBV8644439.1 hypothetical protein [Candidatus Eremiobacteraeota bacterium]